MIRQLDVEVGGCFLLPPHPEPPPFHSPSLDSFSASVALQDGPATLIWYLVSLAVSDTIFLHGFKKKKNILCFSKSSEVLLMRKHGCKTFSFI